MKTGLFQNRRLGLVACLAVCVVFLIAAAYLRASMEPSLGVAPFVLAGVGIICLIGGAGLMGFWSAPGVTPKVQPRYTFDYADNLAAADTKMLSGKWDFVTAPEPKHLRTYVVVKNSVIAKAILALVSGSWDPKWKTKQGFPIIQVANQDVDLIVAEIEGTG